jgi:HAD superfamily hydrolase (TIGR01549 family)
MNKIKLVIFDLDGTLIDSGSTIYKATIATFEKLGMKVNLPKNELDKRIGAHFADIFNELNIQVDDIEYFIKVYKTLYFDYIDDSTLYSGVVEILEHLYNNNYKIALLTTKAQGQAELILEHFKLTKYFDYIMGRRPGIMHKPSPEPLLIISETLKVKPEETLMVGDTELDIQCGKSASAQTCGVSYGYRSELQLKREAPDYLVNSVLQLKEIL